MPKRAQTSALFSWSFAFDIYLRFKKDNQAKNSDNTLIYFFF